jgi:hypothetical protein
MSVFQDLSEEGEVKVGLVLELAFKCPSLLPEVITGASLHIDQNSGKADPLEVGTVFSIKRLTTGTDKPPHA